MTAPIEIAGHRFGSRVALRYLGASRWLCRCDCGSEGPAYSFDLRAGRSSQCRECFERKFDFDGRWDVAPESGCWNWIGATSNEGYAQFSADGKRHLAHCYAYERSKGPIPQGPMPSRRRLPAT